MSLALDANSLIPVKLVNTVGGNAVTSAGYVDMPASQVVSGGSAFTAAATQADSVAADVATLKTDFNALLAKLKAAGLMAAA